MTSDPARSLRWMPALILALSLGVVMNAEAIVSTVFSAPSDAIRVALANSAATLGWFAGAALFNQLSRWLLFDTLMARAIDGPVPGVLKEISAVLVYLVAITCIVGFVFERSVTGFLAALGAGGVVLGFALRNLFADLFTGLAINIDRTFAFGDWVQINEGLAAPTVAQIREIGWRCTCLTTEEQTTVVMPNSLLGQERVVNISSPVETTRFEVKVAVEFDVPVHRVKRVLLAALKSLSPEDGFDTGHDPVVLIGDTSAVGVEYVLRYWILPWHPVSPTSARDRVYERVLEHLRLAGITLAYPKTDVFHAEMPTRQVEGHAPEDEFELLSRISLFDVLSGEELRQVVADMARRVVPAGHELVRSGDAGASLFVLIEGLLDVEVERGGLMHKVGLIQPGQFFGEMSLLTGAPRSATVRSLTECVAYEIDKDVIQRCMAARPEIAEALSRKLAARQLETSREVERGEPSPEADEIDTFARQLLGRMRDFLQAHRPPSV